MCRKTFYDDYGEILADKYVKYLAHKGITAEVAVVYIPSEQVTAYTVIPKKIERRSER